MVGASKHALCGWSKGVYSLLLGQRSMLLVVGAKKHIP